jgi:exodeoxyribonuclease III
MKIISWNVNGLRAITKKHTIFNNEEGTFEEFVNQKNPDILCLSEIKMNCKVDSLLSEILPQYKYKFWSHCSKSTGRHGVAVFSKIRPISPVIDKLGDFDGRYLELEFEKYYLVSIYAQNSGEENLKNLELRKKWDSEFLKRVTKLKAKKEVILTGDFNVVHLPIDTSNFEKQRNKVAGVTDLERNNFKNLLSKGFFNVFRILHPEKIKFTYFSYRTRGRKYNSGMQIDYFLVTQKLLKYVKSINILDNIYGSDHLPIQLILD